MPNIKRLIAVSWSPLLSARYGYLRVAQPALLEPCTSGLSGQQARRWNAPLRAKFCQEDGGRGSPQGAIEEKKVVLGLGCHRPASEEVDLLSLGMSALPVKVKK